MTNEELAISIQQGNTALIPILWEQVSRFIFLLAFRYLNGHRETCTAAGVTLEDLKQEGYFAMLEALKAWTSESGNTFMTFLKYPCLNHFNTICGIRQRRKNPLNASLSFETPTGDDITLGDAIEDPRDDYEELDQSEYIKALHNDIERAMERLTPSQEQVIRSFYFYQKSMAQTEEQMGLTAGSAAQLQNAALRKLRQSKYIMSYRQEIIYSFGFRSSLSSFRDTGMSSTERAVEALDRANI